MNHTEDPLLNMTSSVNTSTTTTVLGAGGWEWEEEVCVPGTEHVPVIYPPAAYRHDLSPVPLRHSTQAHVALKITFYVLIMVVDTVGNGLVMVVVAVNRKMRTPTNLLLVNLALADLLLCLLCMWVHLGNSLHQDWPFGPVICKVNMFAQVAVITSSVLTLTVISVERFVAIVFPLCRGWTLRLTTVLIGVIWVIACSIASPQLHVRQLEEYEFKDRHVIICREYWTQVYLDTTCLRYWSPTKVLYHLLVGVVLFLVPILIMGVCYTVICVCLLCRKTPGAASSSSSSSAQTKRRVVRMLVMVVVVFVICWTPIHVIETITLFQPEHAATEETAYAALFIGYTNSALNPVMYAGFNENFRRGFQQMFRCRFLANSNRVAPHGKADL
ncbi:QRFP-like peptide receptor [Babylonia areolata]|uniref:QRFP-like peptide receptor n=1 Tax=Babylonia areolata TaxID=304850 RepID=UPI003FD54D1A